MARSSKSSGSYREWEAARRAEERAAEQAARLEEQRRKARERERAVAEAAARDRKAAARTLAVDQRIAELERLLRSSLARDPRISLDSLRRRAMVSALDLGQLGVPLRALNEYALPWCAWRRGELSPPDFLEAQHSLLTNLALDLAEGVNDRMPYPDLIKALRVPEW